MGTGMQESMGRESARIWLIGDSEPAALAHVLRHPLDARHPTRHSIWTPIWDEIQQELFRQRRARLDGDALYVRNAIQRACDKPKSSTSLWALDDRIKALRERVETHKPALVLSFGGFAFEFCRRAVEPGSQSFPYRHWTVKRLAAEFASRIDNPGCVVVPLLHAVVARGKFLHCHEMFGGPEAQYFAWTGKALATRLLRDIPQGEGGWLG